MCALIVPVDFAYGLWPAIVGRGQARRRRVADIAVWPSGASAFLDCRAMMLWVAAQPPFIVWELEGLPPELGRRERLIQVLQFGIKHNS